MKSSSSSAPKSSSSVKNSSSSTKVSSSSVKSSSSSKAKSSSSSLPSSIIATKIPQFSIQIDARDILISAARIGDTYALFDMQGKVLMQGRVPTSSFNMTVGCPGNYLLQIGNRTQRVMIK